MKKLIIFTVIVITTSTTVFGQCTSLFSYAAYFETVTFINQSNVSNAHYYWNFGDGIGSNFQNPIHDFPETGNYLVTLFAKDTISNCSSYYEYWVNVTKYSPDSCQTSITDSIFTSNGNDYLKIIDNSSNCNGYYSNVDGGPVLNFPSNSWISINGYWQTIAFRMVSRVQYYSNDTINGYQLHREAYKTSLHNYSSTKNYGDCSANFEFTVVSQDTIGQRILFKAMNKTATHYEWYIAGFGAPITSNNDTISQFYPFNSNDLQHTGLIIQGSSGCSDTLFQNILIRENIQTIESISEVNNQVHYTLYPNPFSQQATLDFPSIKEKTTFTLYNTNGQLVRTVKNIIGGQFIINRDNLPTGVYYFMLITKNKIIATGKLITE